MDSAIVLMKIRHMAGNPVKLHFKYIPALFIHIFQTRTAMSLELSTFKPFVGNEQGRKSPPLNVLVKFL